jgi:sortase A
MRYNPAVPNSGVPDDYSVEELRRLLVEKRRSSRTGRLEHFRRTGRVVSLASDADTASLDGLRSTELTGQNDQLSSSKPRSNLRRLFDGGLLIIEVGAVLSLMFVLFNGLEILRELNQESIKALELPTLTPTPLIVAVVLPSGHTPPDSTGSSRFNEAEIPEHLRPLYQSLAAVPIPTPAPEHASRIQIPAIGVEAPIVQGTGEEQLKKGVGQYIGSANPGEKNNIVLTAHNDIFGEIFRDLDKLQPGDQVIVYTSQRSYTYFVTETQVVEPTQVEVMAPTDNAIVTLISCYPYRIDNKRIVVTGHLQSGSR